jgi:hypothetical protein
MAIYLDKCTTANMDKGFSCRIESKNFLDHSVNYGPSGFCLTAWFVKVQGLWSVSGHKASITNQSFLTGLHVSFYDSLYVVDYLWLDTLGLYVSLW